MTSKPTVSISRRDAYGYVAITSMIYECYDHLVVNDDHGSPVIDTTTYTPFVELARAVVTVADTHTDSGITLIGYNGGRFGRERVHMICRNDTGLLLPVVKAVINRPDGNALLFSDNIVNALQFLPTANLALDRGFQWKVEEEYFNFKPIVEE